MSPWEEIWPWLTGSSTFRGVPGVPELLLEHLLLSAAAMGLAVLLALPVAVWLGHVGRFERLSVGVANAFRAVPAFGLILLAFTFAGFSTTALVVVFALIGLAPIFINAYVGVAAVDPEVVDAARGMGLTETQILRRVELPLALPVIMAGIRTATVNVIATVPLASVVAFDGLGRPILSGLSQGVTISPGARTLVTVGALLVALLAVGADLLLGVVERAAAGHGRGIRRRDLRSATEPSATI